MVADECSQGFPLRGASTVDRSLTAISAQTSIYALTELVRRAGVSNAFFQRWRVTSTVEGGLLVQPERGASRLVHFPVFPTELHQNRVLRKTWHAEGPAEYRQLVPDFI